GRDVELRTTVNVLRDWVDELQPVPHVSAGVPREFIDEAVAKRLSDYRKWAHRWRATQIITAASTVILGLLGSLLAGLQSGHGFAIFAGAAVAALATFTHAASPGRKADGYEHARLQLQDEVWNLVHHEGRYADTATPAEAYSRFYRTVCDIVRRKRAQTELGSQTSGDAPATG
ncbi:MAG TPA: hypothetical protein VGH24_11260, partial [Solirubrobacteraceae bacterium]